MKGTSVECVFVGFGWFSVLGPPSPTSKKIFFYRVVASLGRIYTNFQLAGAPAGKKHLFRYASARGGRRKSTPRNWRNRRCMYEFVIFFFMNSGSRPTVHGIFAASDKRQEGNLADSLDSQGARPRVAFLPQRHPSPPT